MLVDTNCRASYIPGMKAQAEIDNLLAKIKAGKLAPDEPLFVLRAQDCLAPQVIGSWLSYARVAGVPQSKVLEVVGILEEFRNWPTIGIPGKPETVEQRQVQVFKDGDEKPARIVEVTTQGAHAALVVLADGQTEQYLLIVGKPEKYMRPGCRGKLVFKRRDGQLIANFVPGPEEAAVAEHATPGSPTHDIFVHDAMYLNAVLQTVMSLGIQELQDRCSAIRGVQAALVTLLMKHAGIDTPAAQDLRDAAEDSLAAIGDRLGFEFEPNQKLTPTAKS